MAKRSQGKPHDIEVFRDSDFIGADPRIQSQLSTSLNTLSQRVATAKRALAELPNSIYISHPVEAPEVGGSNTAPPPDAAASDEADGTAI